MEGKQNDLDLANLECPRFVDFVSGLEEPNDDFFGTYGSARKDIGEQDGEFAIVVPSDEDIAMHGSFEARQNLILQNNSTESDRDNFLQATPNHNLNIVQNIRVSTRRRSKSMGDIHMAFVREDLKQKIDEPIKVEAHQPRKSLSALDLREKKTMKVYPKTPQCLRRTMEMRKTKIVKTSEEIELEKIANMRKQLAERMKQNEISLKKLGMSRKPHVFPLNAPKNPRKVEMPEKRNCATESKNSARTFRAKENKNAKVSVAPPNFQQNMRKTPFVRPTAVAHSVKKIDPKTRSNIDKVVSTSTRMEPPKTIPKGNRDNAHAAMSNAVPSNPIESEIFNQTQAGSADTSRLETVCKKVMKDSFVQQKSSPKYHSGLTFIPKQVKTVVVKPFNIGGARPKADTNKTVLVEAFHKLNNAEKPKGNLPIKMKLRSSSEADIKIDKSKMEMSLNCTTGKVNANKTVKENIPRRSRFYSVNTVFKVPIEKQTKFVKPNEILKNQQ